MRFAVTVPAVLGLWVGAAAAQQTSVTTPAARDTVAAGPIRATTWISQTAVWTGDPLDYSVRLDLAPRVQLPEDLTGETLAWAPFRRLGFAQTEEVHPDGSRAVTLHYRLVPVDLPERGVAQIPPLRVAYVQLPDRPVARDEMAAQELIVEGPRVVFRSTLEVPPEEATIRDGKELLGSDLAGRTLVIVGLVGLLLGAVPFARSAQAAVKRALERRREAAARGSRRHARQEVAALRNAPLTTPEDYERLYEGLFSALRSHLATELEIPYPGLTSIDAAGLQKAGLREDMADRVVAFLRECEAVRFQQRLPDDAEPRARQAVALVEQVVAA